MKIQCKYQLLTLLFLSNVFFFQFAFLSQQLSNAEAINFIVAGGCYAQNIGINSTGANAHPSALLDIDAIGTPSLGLLIPRIALQAVNISAPINSPATSLLVYNTSTASSGTNAVIPGYYYWNGIKWLRLANGSSSSDSQTLSIFNSSITISNGNTIELPAEIDGSVINELQNLTMIGKTLLLSLGGGSVNIDPSSTNELQTLSISSNTLTLSNGGGSIPLPISSNSQILSLVLNSLTISNGNIVNLAGISGFIHQIGDSFGGGVIADLWKDNLGNEHGIITSTVDISTSATWGCNGSSTWTGTLSPYNGVANTATIVAHCGLNTAATKCTTYNGGSFTDWFLPSRNEWQPIYTNLNKINKTLESIGGVKIEYTPTHPYDYWTSNETDPNNAFYFDVQHGGCWYNFKYNSYAVRAIRTF